MAKVYTEDTMLTTPQTNVRFASDPSFQSASTVDENAGLFSSIGKSIDKAAESVTDYLHKDAVLEVKRQELIQKQKQQDEEARSGQEFYKGTAQDASLIPDLLGKGYTPTQVSTLLSTQAFVRASKLNLPIDKSNTLVATAHKMYTDALKRDVNVVDGVATAYSYWDDSVKSIGADGQTAHVARVLAKNEWLGPYLQGKSPQEKEDFIKAYAADVLSTEGKTAQLALANAELENVHKQMSISKLSMELVEGKKERNADEGVNILMTENAGVIREAIKEAEGKKSSANDIIGKVTSALWSAYDASSEQGTLKKSVTRAQMEARLKPTLEWLHTVLAYKTGETKDAAAAKSAEIALQTSKSRTELGLGDGYQAAVLYAKAANSFAGYTALTTLPKDNLEKVLAVAGADNDLSSHMMNLNTLKQKFTTDKVDLTTLETPLKKLIKSIDMDLTSFNQGSNARPDSYKLLPNLQFISDPNVMRVILENDPNGKVQEMLTKKLGALKTVTLSKENLKQNDNLAHLVKLATSTFGEAPSVIIDRVLNLIPKTSVSTQPTRPTVSPKPQREVIGVAPSTTAPTPGSE